MDVNRRNALLTGLVTAVLAVIWAWLTQTYLITARSEFVQAVNMMWVVIHLPLHVMLSVLSPPRYLDTLAFLLGVFMQWFAIGWAGSRLKKRLLTRKDDEARPIA